MNVVLVGGGGHCASCIEIIQGNGIAISGIVSPEPVAELCGFPRLGDDSWLDSPDARSASFLITVGQVSVSPLRARLLTELRVRGLALATVISKDATVAADARVGGGSIVMSRAVVNVGATVGMNCIVNTGAIVEHHASIGDNCHISTGAIVNGGADIGAGSMIGSGVIVLHGLRIAPGTVVGAGAVVIEDIDEPGTWVGVPAKKVK